MIGEIIPEGYDIFGTPTFRPRRKRFRTFAPTFPMGRYVMQPLSVRCETLDDVRRFLLTCRYLSDTDQFGNDDYWMPPEDFEKRRAGDCDDFALWAWRQLIELGKEDVRFVAGVAGRYWGGHAWVTYLEQGKPFLLEATAPRIATIPRLETTRYVPALSVSWDGDRLRYFEHERLTYNPPISKAAPLFFDWLWFRARTYPRWVAGSTMRLLRRSRRRIAAGSDARGSN